MGTTSLPVMERKATPLRRYGVFEEHDGSASDSDCVKRGSGVEASDDDLLGRSLGDTFASAPPAISEYDAHGYQPRPVRRQAPGRRKKRQQANDTALSFEEMDDFELK